MAKLTFTFKEERDERGPRFFVGFQIEKCTNEDMNEMASLVKDLVYEKMQDAMQLLYESQMKKEFDEKLKQEFKNDIH
ncbi:hypothetical protein [Vibrio parahaemolyticus]|uniref:hypothetical protein n=1 Tax=Vibrio parahaemolyticus TaxID=670 RepID=UPI00215D394A|nr:hypothetical protein [Vibrio parahaemolyticus]MCR9669411.1 hypothetical protein [Vibrio parahaemolyticus]MCR9826724.1 hypothetical protein [Vibrio parahaemolyticus]